MLLLILAYLPNVRPDVTQMSHSTIGWLTNFAEYSIVLLTCWSKLGRWVKGQMISKLIKFTECGTSLSVCTNA